jgi:hypothetical protein
MALVVRDRVKQFSTTAGTGTLTLGSTPNGFQSFSTIGDGNTTYYTIVNGSTGDFEVGIGTYTLSGDTLSRDTVLASSNSGSLVNFNADSKDVFVVYPAERAVFTDVVQTLTNKTISGANNTLSNIPNSATTATNANTASSIVARDASGNFSAGTITAALSGNAATATALQNARTIGGVSFDGTANINLPGVNTAGNQNTSGTAANVTGTVAIANGGTGATTQQTAINALAGAVTSAQYLRGNGTNVLMSAIQAADVPTLNQNTTGSAATLTTARNINGTSFNGSADITTANWGTSRSISIGGTSKSVNGSENVSWAASDISAQTAVNYNGVAQGTYTPSLRSNVAISGGGTITVNATGSVLWNARFIVISNGSGTNFSTTGYFDITCPTSGTITGVGGAANVTATAAGIPLAAWQAIYYILPIGSANTSVAANFRVASYTSALDVPHNWVLICVRNGDNGQFYFTAGYILSLSQSIATGTYDARRANFADVLTTARTIGGVSFDGSANINLPGVNTAGNQSTSGNAATATILQTARTINGVSFNGSANITVADGTKLPLTGGTMTGTITNSASSLVIGNSGGVIRGYLYNDSSGFGFLTSGGGWAARVNFGTANFQLLGTLFLTGNATSLRQETTSTWSGDANPTQGKLEYHSNRWYLAAGSSSVEVVRFRRGSTDVSYINTIGEYVGNASSATRLTSATGNPGSFSARAWVNFDGTTAGTNPASMTIRGSGNVSSVTRTATGQYTINFITAMPDVNYSYLGTARLSGNGTGNTNAGVEGSGSTAPTVSALAVWTKRASTITNMTDVCVAIFR